MSHQIDVKKEKAKLATRKWRASREGAKKFRLTCLKYKNSIKGIENRKRYRMSERSKLLNRSYKAKEEYKVKQRIWRIKPENKLREKRAIALRMNNPEIRAKAAAASAEWRRSKKGKEWTRAYEIKARKISPQFKISRYLRTRMYRALKYQSAFKFKKTFDLLGCSTEFFKSYLESKFSDGMSWENYGPYWHIDHIIPCIKHDLTDLNEQKKCFHYSNLQPLRAFDNYSKNGRILEIIQPELLLNI